MQEQIPQPTRIAEKAPGKTERVVTQIKELPRKVKEIISSAKERLCLHPREALKIIGGVALMGRRLNKILLLTQIM